MSDERLLKIQQLQFIDKVAAETATLSFLNEVFTLDIASVELRPLAVSLNSFNGYMTLRDGQRYFFKTHIESDSILHEYYQGERLSEAGYPVLRPVMRSTEAGRQVLVYEVISAPSVFDVAWAIENGDESSILALTKAQYNSDDQLLALYRATLKSQTSQSAASAAIHQLFHHRITQGRLQRFYGTLEQPTAREHPLMGSNAALDFRRLRGLKWRINGQFYGATLDQLIERSTRVLEPSRGEVGIIGHGDAHNGNVFLLDQDTNPRLMYFDPAFAGMHHPLLDLAKPLFHNVFAMWMYFPQEKAEKLALSWRIEGDSIAIEHDYHLHPIRHMFLKSKVDLVLVPMLIELKRTGNLMTDWRMYLKSALSCCPLLTKDLLDSKTYPPMVALLALSMTIEMGLESQEVRSLIDAILDDVERAIS
jgi:hypothetical protein